MDTSRHQSVSKNKINDINNEPHYMNVTSKLYKQITGLNQSFELAQFS